MKEGFDVGLEMSGNPAAFRDMLGQHVPRRQDRHARHPHRRNAIDWTKVVFNMLTIKGIYGREMYETWYKMTVMIQSGLDINPVITHRFHYTEFEKGFDGDAFGQLGQGGADVEGRVGEVFYPTICRAGGRAPIALLPTPMWYNAISCLFAGTVAWLQEPSKLTNRPT